MLTAQENTVEARLVALDAQQRSGHGYFGEIKAAFILLGSHMDFEKAKSERGREEDKGMHWEMRNLLSQTREQLRQEVGNVVPNAVQTAFNDHGIDAKILDIEKALTAMKAGLQELHDRGGAGAQIVEKLRSD